jgi:hypothetical protein
VSSSSVSPAHVCVSLFIQQDWKHIAAVVFEHARSEAQCALRWAKVLSVGLKKGQWTEDEDAAVREQVELAGGALNVKWNAVADALPGRLGKQVRERWQNHLDPALSKEPWEEAEDQLLVSLQAVMGNKWSEIARAFGGRSENSVKNRWNSKQRRSLAAERKRRTGSELGIMPAPDHATLAAKVAAISGSSSSRTTSSSSRGGNPSSSSSRSIESRESFASEGKDGEGKGSWEPRNDDDDDDSCIKIDFSKALQAANSPTVATAAASSSLTQPPASASHRRQSHQSLLPPPVASTPASSSSSGAGSSSSRASGYRAAGFAGGLRAAAADQKDEKDARRRRPLPLSPSPPGKISSSSSGSSSSDYPAEARQRWASSGADPLAALCATAEAHESMGSSEPWRHFSAFAAAAGAVAPLEVNQPPMASSLPPPPPFHTQHHTLARATSDDEVREAGAALLEIMGME